MPPLCEPRNSTSSTLCSTRVRSICHSVVCYFLGHSRELPETLSMRVPIDLDEAPCAPIMGAPFLDEQRVVKTGELPLAPLFTAWYVQHAVRSPLSIMSGHLADEHEYCMHVESSPRPTDHYR